MNKIKLFLIFIIGFLIGQFKLPTSILLIYGLLLPAAIAFAYLGYLFVKDLRYNSGDGGMDR